MLIAGDVGDAGALRLAIELASERAELPLSEVYHLAGSLDDGLLGALTEARFEKVLRPKLTGALHLHRLTESLTLDAFVLFSSLVGMVGSPGQGNYAAANAGLDALVIHRRQRGLPAASVAFGPWAEGGMEIGRAHV